MNKLSLILLLGLFFLGSAAAVAQAQQDTIKLYQNSTPYVCTGIAESKDDPRWADPKYTKLMFTTGERAYVSNMDVKIKDSASQVVLEASCDAPWLLVELKPGKYQVEALAVKKYTRNATIQVTEGKRTELAIRFTEITGDGL